MISWIASTIFGVHYSLRNFRICQTVLRRRLPLTSGWSGRRRTAPRTSCRTERCGRHTPKSSM
ncbi:hypothetical protein CA843_030465 [Escherichia coli]|nr:hypothetical protein CA843_030465 [Escherichia coli]